MEKKIELMVQSQIKTEILVVGGGVAGVSAALGAARKGRKVLLCEQDGCLGGMATLGCVSPLDAVATRDGISFGGILKEIVEEQKEMNAVYANADGNPVIHPHLLKLILTKKLWQEQVSVLFHTMLCHVNREADMLKKAYFLSKSGVIEVEAQVFIDASGDGDLFAMAGDDYNLGIEENAFSELKESGFDKMHFEDDKAEGKINAYEGKGALQPVSAMFTMGGVNVEKGKKYCNRLLTYEDLGISREEFMQLSYAGSEGFEENGALIPLPQGRILFYESTRKGEVVVNMSRVIHVNATDTWEASRAGILTQLQVLYLVDFLKRFVPGFENSYFMECSSTLGIRESRRLKGRKILTGEEVIRCECSEEDIAYGSYMIDIHDPFGKRKAIGGEIKGAFYGVPYGTLISANISNLLVCGRCISVDHVAHSSTRIQGTCIQTGQAAGTAAALCIRMGVSPAELDVQILRKVLLEDGMFQKKKTEA